MCWLLSSSEGKHQLQRHTYPPRLQTNKLRGWEQRIAYLIATAITIKPRLSTLEMVDGRQSGMEVADIYFIANGR